MSEAEIMVNIGTNNRSVDVAVTSNTRNVDVSVSRNLPDFPIYHGEHTFTATAEEQTIHVSNFTMLNDIVINPIPQTYGLITYDGSTLTVS